MELALWSFHFAKKLQPDLLETNSNSEESDQLPEDARGRKRTSGDTETVSGDKEEDSSSVSTKKRKL